jgi:hypothetical protein
MKLVPLTVVSIPADTVFDQRLKRMRAQPVANLMTLWEIQATDAVQSAQRDPRHGIRTAR